MAYQGYKRLHNFIQRSRLVESLSLSEINVPGH